MHIPTQFSDEMADRFHNRFRLRWSDKSHVFHLEQKVMTGQVMEPPIDPETNEWDAYDDGFIRARDGYFYILTVTVGDRMRCPIDNTTLKVPTFHTGEVVCDTCRAHNRDGRYAAGFFPLNHVLLDHISDIDPMNGGPLRARARMRAKQITRQERENRDATMEGEYNTIDNINQAELRPMVGYGPKTAQRGEAGIGYEAALRDRLR